MEIVCPGWHPEAEKLTDAIPLLADQGVTAIELGLGSPDYFDPREAFELKKLLTRLGSCGVRVHSVHAPFGADCDISSSDDNAHERGVDTLIDSLEVASVLGAGCVVLHAGHVISDDRRRRLERARGVLREVCVVARESGILLAVENLPPGYLGDNPEEVMALLEDVNCESVGVCFDSGHANLSGDFERFTQELLPVSVTTHIHDNNGREDQHSFPGQGCIDWLFFASVYHSSNCDAAVMLECLPPHGCTWGEAFQRFRAVLGD